jgi:hypothetical protein
MSPLFLSLLFLVVTIQAGFRPSITGMPCIRFSTIVQAEFPRYRIELIWTRLFQGISQELDVVLVR